MTDKELNNLPPSLRQKSRYLKFRIHSEENIDLGEFVDEVWDQCLDYLGTRGTSEVDFWIIKNQFKEKDQKGIIKVKRDKTEDLRAVLGLINNIEGKKSVIEVTAVSGSIKQLKDN